MSPNERTAAEEMAAECVGVRMRLLTRIATNVYDDALRPFGLRISQGNILVAVAASGPLRAVDLAAILHLEKSTLSRDLQRMVAHGWISSEAGEGNSLLLSATSAGVELLEKIRPAWREAQAEVKGRLSAELVAQASVVVDRLWRSDPALADQRPPEAR